MQKSKKSLRKKFFLIRKKKYFEIKSSFFKPLIKIIKKKFNKKKIKLSIYYPASFEVNVLKLFQLKYIKKIELLLPAITGNNSMHFYKWQNHSVLSINKFGMLEPYKLTDHIIPEVILVPLLAYDNQKNRLGYGGGFYDRYLKKYLTNNKRTLSIGIAFSFQNYPKLPVSNYDVKLNYILTEKGML
jgi:5-formyltetrahydrofolate cyclo-ligase